MSKKWFLYLVLPLLIVAFLFQLVLQSRFVSKKVTGLLVEQVAAVVAQPVSISHVSLHLFPPMVLIEAPVMGDQKRGFSFSAKDIRLTFDFASLFTETFILRSIVLNEAVFDIVSKGDEHFSAPKNDSPTSSSVPPKILIREIQLKKAQLHFQGKGPITQLLLSDIESTIKPDFAMKNFEVAFASREGAFLALGIQKPINLFKAQFVLSSESVTLKKAQVIASTASILATGTVDFRAESGLNLNLDLDVPLSSVSRALAGQSWAEPLMERKIDGTLNFFGKLSGALKDPQVVGKVTLPELAIENRKIGFLRADLRYHDKNIALSPFSGALFSGTFSGEAEASLGSGVQETHELSFRSAAGSGEGAKIPEFKIALEYEMLPLDKLLAFLPPQRLKPRDLSGLVLTGELALSKTDSEKDQGQPRAQGQFEIKRESLLSEGAPEASSQQGLLVALLESAGLRWQWSNDTLEIAGGVLQLAKTGLAFEGQWSGAKGLFLETTLVSTDIVPVTSALRVPLSGRLNLQGALTLKKGNPDFTGGLFLDSGTLRGQAFKNFTADVHVSRTRIKVKKAVLNIEPKERADVFSSPAGYYLASGSLDWRDVKQVNFDFDLSVKNGNPQEVFDFLGLEIPLYATGSGVLKIKGTPKSFFVKGPLSVSKGLLYGEKFDSGTLDLTVNQQEVRLDKVVLKRGRSILTGHGGIGYNSRYWLSLKADHLRIKEAHVLRWMPEEVQGEVGLVVSGKGSFAEPQFRFVAAVKDLNYGDLSGVKGSIRADWIKSSVQFEGEFPDHHIALTGEVRLAPNYPFDFEGHFEQLQIDPLFRQKLSPPSSKVRILASGHLVASGALFSPERISLSGTLSEFVAGFDAYELHNKGPLTLKATEGQFIFEDTELEGENTSLTLNGSLTLNQNWNLFLEGKADLNLISFFSKKIASGRGLAELDLVITDRWLNPSIRGALSVENGTIRSDALRQPLHVSQLNALFDQERVILENFRGNIGGGKLFATGKADLEGLSVKDFSLLFELDGVRFDLAEELPATFDGELFFQKKGSQATLKGDLEVRNVVYDKKTDLKTLIVGFINGKAPELERETPVIGRTQINVHLYGKENIQISNNLAKLPLTTDFLVKGTVDQPQILGRIELLDGDIFFQRNTFRVVSGSVDFLNPDKVDPVFNLVARTDVRNEVTDRRYRIDLGLTGTLAQITLNWTSFPALPEVDILALLAIGKTTADLAEAQGSAGAEATNFVVNAFLIEPVDQLTQIVGAPVEKITGIDQIRVDPYVTGDNSNTTASTRVTAKKRLLKDKLVVIYTTTLDASEEDVFRMVYEINQHMSLVGKRDDLGQLGGDLRFRFEFR